MERIVIVGAGLAGHRAALAARKDGFSGELVLVGDEAHRPYDRPPLSKQVLSGAMPAAATAYRDDVPGLRWLGSCAAAALRPDDHELDLADGTALAYDGLVIATGRRARTLPHLASLSGVHVLRSVDDALAFRAAAARAQRVVIVGAGFVGCEVAATLRARGTDVTVVDVAPLPMTPLGPEVGARAAALHEAHGVALRLGAGVAGLTGTRAVDGVELTDGTHLPADVVLLALGSVPNTEWLARSGLELTRGAVRCDATGAVLGAEDVVAAGDVAAWPHPLADGREVCVEHWAIARDMGAAAVRTLLAPDGARVPFTPVPTFWSDQHGVKLKSAGLLSTADRWEVVEEDLDRSELVVEARRGDELVGVVTWNRPRRVIECQRTLSRRLALLGVA